WASPRPTSSPACRTSTDPMSGSAFRTWRTRRRRASNWPNCGEARGPRDLRTDPTNGERRPNRRRSIGPDERAPRTGLELEVRTEAVNSLGNHIWDLRQGDADDNRTSPYGRGWRNVVISTAMEFNYLTATVSFIMLVIVPALSVGLVPPLFIIYSRK